MRNSIGELLIFLVFAGVSLLVKFLEQKRKAQDKIPPPASAPGGGKGPAPADAAPGEWTPDYEMLKEFAEEQKRAGRPLDPAVAAALEAARPAVPEPEVAAGPSEAELAMLEEQRRLAELAAELECRRQDAAAAFAPAAPEADGPAPAPEYGGGALASLRRDPQSAVVLAEILAPPAALRPRRSL